MHGPSPAATLAAALWFGLAAAAAGADTPAESIARARALLAKDDAKGAIALLSEALPDAGADRGPMVVVLRQAYARAADQATKAGRADEAAELREDLQILNRKLRGRDGEAKPTEPRPRVTAPEPSVAPAPRAMEKSQKPEVPAPEPAPPRPGPHPEPPRPDPMPAMPRFEDVPRPAPIPGLDERKAPAIEPFANQRDPLAMDAPAPAPAPARPEAKPVSRPADPAPRDRDVARTAAPREAVAPPLAAAPVTAADVGGATPPIERPASPPPASPAPRAEPPSKDAQLLRTADAAYLKGLYLDANVHYTALAKLGKLPDDRKNNWVYCRAAEVLRRINAKPATAREWAEIHREIAAIKAMNPKFWYAEYLRNLATEESRGAPRRPAAAWSAARCPRPTTRPRPPHASAT